MPMADDSIPFVDLRAQYHGIREDVLAAVRAVFESQRFILGPEVERFEGRVAELLGVEPSRVIGVSSGTDALLVSLMALGIGPGDRVLTTAFSFFATAGAIARLGATPEFCDIDPGTLNIDPRVLAERDPADYRAVIVVHLFGRSADLDAIERWAAGVPIIEDAAQALGAVDGRKRRCGTMGAAGCFSFFPTKNLGGAGDGGLVVAGNDALARSIRLLRVHGAPDDYEHAMIGGNFRLDAIQAAVLGVKLGYLERWNRMRLGNALEYLERFRELGLEDCLRPPPVPGDGTYVAHQFVVRCRDRDRLRDHLSSRGIGTAVYYPTPLPHLECFKRLGARPGDYPVAEAAARDVLALPIHPELKPGSVARVVGAIADFYSQHSAP